MEDIENRLKKATEDCLKSYAEWSKDKKEGKFREGLMEAVHELRKVAARLEIDMAISERNEMASKPIPIPAHRSNKRKQEDNADDNRGNSDKPQGRKPPRRKAGGGGGGNKES